MTAKRLFWGLALMLIGLMGCTNDQADAQKLRLATTTSTDNSGLLNEILPIFEEAYSAQVDVIAVGTGQAIALGESGDVDIILVHARSREESFVRAGHGTARSDLMYNDFIIVGPPSDPAGIKGISLASDALAQIAETAAIFASRGDDSGTHIKEQAQWEAAGLPPKPEGDWYKSLGQGMGDTLRFANEAAAYTLTDRGTFLALSDTLPALTIMVGGENIAANEDPSLFNPYGVIPVHPDKENINHELSLTFIAWLTSVETQSLIESFGMDRYNQPLFYPDSEPWRNR